MAGVDLPLERILDLGGIFVFALSGASLGARKGFDAVGILVLGLVTALGGGLLRDVLISDVPPSALRDQAYLAVPVVASVIVLVGHRVVERLHRPVQVFDAAGLGLFCVAGTTKALDAGLGATAAVLLGTMTAVGGGVLRDVLAREVPMIFRADSQLYAIPAALGAAATVAANELEVEPALAAAAIATAVFVVRLLAMRRGWRAPTARAGDPPT